MSNRELKYATLLRQREVICFYYLSCLNATKFISLSIFSLVETSSLKIWERPRSWHAECSVPVSVRGSKASLMCPLVYLAFIQSVFNNYSSSPEWAIDSEAMRARGIIVLVKSNYLVKKVAQPIRTQH